MERVKVESTSVASVGYDANMSVLEIEFHNGKTYRYAHVPVAAYRLLMQAESIGRFVNEFIKPKFTATRV